MLFAQLDAPTCFQPLDVEPAEIAVVRLLRRIEIDAIRGPVRVAVLLEVDDEPDLLLDMIGRLAQDRRLLDVEAPHVDQERIGVELRDFPGGLARAPRALLHLVLACVGVGSEMADVGHVHHVPHAVAVPFENAPQRVHEHECAEIADMLVVVDGRPAGVEAHLAVGAQRHERAQRPRVVVVERERSRHCSQMAFAIT